MLRILRFLVTGQWKTCEHTFATTRVTNLVGRRNDLPTAIVYHQECSKCGKISSTRIDY